MPSPNGYITNVVFSPTERTWVRLDVQYDADNPPWLPGQAGSYDLEFNVGPVGGPYALATTTTVNECNPGTNPTSPMGTTSTILGVGAPAGSPGALTPGTNYELEIVVRDPGNVEVDRWAVPFSTDPLPTTFSPNTNTITQTTAEVILGNAGQNVMLNTACDRDQAVFGWSTTPGGPYTDGPMADVSGASPSHTFTGLPEGTTVYWRAQLFDESGALYYTSPESSFDTLAADDYDPQCLPADPLGANTATVSGTADNVPGNLHLRLALATTSGGPYTSQVSPGFPGTNTPDQSVTMTFTGLTPETTYYYRTEVRDAANAVVDSSAECSFTTAAAVPPAFEPVPCPPGGDGAAGADVEQIILCDLDAEGTLLGTALAVYEYDADGNPVGAPTFVDPATGNPYAVQGTLQTCPDSACLPPIQFCQTSTTTGPVEHPGRQYDITLPINPGFEVQSLQVDQVTNPAGIVWDVLDPDGEAFRQELTSFIEGRVPASATVTITNPNAGVAQVCGAALPMTVHIECVRLDQDPPDLIELIYNGGQDLIQNPAYNESPPLDPPVSQGNYGFRLLSRQDDPGPFPGNPPANDALCTSVANRGWETNDVGRTFEIWGQDIVNGSDVTPTPRGTPVQEMTSDGPPPGGLSTIWQTFQAPASGNFIIRVVHGARDPGETHRITLDNGDTDDAQNGDLIDDVSNPPSVTNNGGPNPWTQFSQTIPLNAGSTYTLALSTTNPVAGARGGLFTDMRAYIDRPGLRATATTDDETCVVTTEETTTNTVCSHWQPQCVGGTISGWQRVDTGETLTNAEFWAQVPAPSCCLPEPAGEGEGSATLSNMLTSDLVCGTVGGVPTTLIRVVTTDPSGGILQEQFLGEGGAPVAPSDWTPGACAASRYVNDVILCDTVPGLGVVSFVRKYVQFIDSTNQGQISGFRDFTFDGQTYTVQGTVGTCAGAVADQETVCWTQTSTGDTVHTGTIRHEDGAGTFGWLLFDQNMIPVPDTEPGLTFVPCAESMDPIAVNGLCLPGGIPIAVVVRRNSVTGVVATDGWIRMDTGAFTSGNPPAGTIACGDSSSVQVSGTFCSVDDTTGDVLALILIEYTYNPDGTIASTRLVNAVDGTTYVVPAGASITTCPTGEAPPDGDLVVLCDDNGPFLRDYRRDDTGAVVAVSDYTIGGVPYATVGTVGSCAGRDQELQILCDANGTRFLRRYNYNLSTGALVSVVNTTLDGSTAFAPVGAVGVCTTQVQTDFDFDQVVLCDANGTAFIRRFTFNSQTGVVTATTNLTLAGAAFAPVGAVGLCSDCCPVVVADELCTNTGSGRGTAIRNANGTISLIDSVTGTAITQANVVPCPGGTSTLNAQGRVIADADAAWTPGTDVAGVLTSVTLTVLSGTATVVDQSGTVMAGLPAGYSATWTAEDANTLQGPQSIDAIGGTVAVVWTQR